jgi:hypothetical protein
MIIEGEAAFTAPHYIIRNGEEVGRADYQTNGWKTQKNGSISSSRKRLVTAVDDYRYEKFPVNPTPEAQAFVENMTILSHAYERVSVGHFILGNFNEVLDVLEQFGNETKALYKNLDAESKIKYKHLLAFIERWKKLAATGWRRL